MYKNELRVDTEHLDYLEKRLNILYTKTKHETRLNILTQVVRSLLSELRETQEALVEIGNKTK